MDTYICELCGKDITIIPEGDRAGEDYEMKEIGHAPDCEKNV